jgi:hypothetical protein
MLDRVTNMLTTTLNLSYEQQSGQATLSITVLRPRQHAAAFSRTGWLAGISSRRYQDKSSVSIKYLNPRYALLFPVTQQIRFYTIVKTERKV